MGPGWTGQGAARLASRQCPLCCKAMAQVGGRVVPPPPACAISLGMH